MANRRLACRLGPLSFWSRRSRLALLARSLWAADQGPRDLAEGVPLAPAERHAVAGSSRQVAERERFAHPGRIGTTFDSAPAV